MVRILYIIQKILSSSGSRTYDGTTNANSDLTLTGLVGTETLNLGGATGTLSSSNAGANQAFALEH